MLNYVYKISFQVETLNAVQGVLVPGFSERLWAGKGSAERCRRWQADKQPALLAASPGHRRFPKTRGSCRLVPFGVVLYTDRDGRAHTHTSSLWTSLCFFSSITLWEVLVLRISGFAVVRIFWGGNSVFKSSLLLILFALLFISLSGKICF